MKRYALLAFVIWITSVPADTLELTPVVSPAGTASLAPRLTATADGRALLTWLEKAPGGRRFVFSLFDGQSFTQPSLIRESDRMFVNWADTPGLAVLPDGRWLAHWLQRSGQGSYAYDVMLAGSTDQGQSWGEPFRPHRDGTLTEHGFVSDYPAGDHRRGLVWLDGRRTAPAAVDTPTDGHDAHASHAGGPMTLRTALVSPGGELAGEQLLDDRVCDCCGTAAGQTNEGPVIAYRDRSDDEIRDIKLVRQAQGQWSEPISIHDDGWRISGCPVNGPALLARGSVVIVAWFTMANDTPEVRLAQSGDGGRTFSSPHRFDSGTALGRVDLAWTPGGFAMSWLNEVPSAAVIRLARFTAAGEQIAIDDLDPVRNDRASGFPRLLAQPDGDLLIAWTGQHLETREAQVHVARIHLP